MVREAKRAALRHGHAAHGGSLHGGAPDKGHGRVEAQHLVRARGRVRGRVWLGLGLG